MSLTLPVTTFSALGFTNFNVLIRPLPLRWRRIYIRTTQADQFVAESVAGAEPMQIVFVVVLVCMLAVVCRRRVGKNEVDGTAHWFIRCCIEQ